MNYRIHIGVGIDNARSNSPLCEFTHEFLSELVVLLENRQEVNVIISKFDEEERYIELNSDRDVLKRFNKELRKLDVKKSIESDFGCFMQACDHAHKLEVQLYIVME